MKITLRQTPSLNASSGSDNTNKKKIPAFFDLKSYEPSGIMEELAFMLIRPPRFIYNPDILNPTRRNSRFKIQHHKIPFDLTLYTQEGMRYVILYLHGNGSSRFQGTLFLPSVPDDVGLACFDFNGCGNREERDYITLGQQECKDVDTAALFLKHKGYTVVGWGRSMGAVSLLMSNECDILVADSAYSNLPQLCKESSVDFVPKACCCCFHCLFPCVLACISCKVHSLSQLDISSMDVVARVKHFSKLDGSQKKSICFLHGQQDTLIPSHHSQRLYEQFKDRKMLVLFEGSHNSNRPQQVISKCFEFIEDAIQATKSKSPAKNRQLGMMNEMKQMQAMSPVKDQTIETLVHRPQPQRDEVETDSRVGEEERREVQFHTEFHSGRYHKAKRQVDKSYCQTGVKMSTSQFRDVMDSEDMEPQFRSSTGSPKKKERLAQKLFARKDQ